MSLVRNVVLIGAVGLVVLVGLAARSGSSAPAPTASCSGSIDSTKWPYFGNYQRRLRNRLVLGVVSVPPAYLQQVVPTHREPWAHGWDYWRKAGLVVRAGSAVVGVSVPKAWRNRVAITWGTGIVSSLRITGCPGPSNVGNAYAGGFYLRSRSACVPLIFRVGTRSATVIFGLGQTCG
jgi:hypothetical protein